MLIILSCIVKRFKTLATIEILDNVRNLLNNRERHQYNNLYLCYAR